jgi:hypothetical protein
MRPDGGDAGEEEIVVVCHLNIEHVSFGCVLSFPPDGLVRSVIALEIASAGWLARH